MSTPLSRASPLRATPCELTTPRAPEGPAALARLALQLATPARARGLRRALFGEFDALLAYEVVAMRAIARAKVGRDDVAHTDLVSEHRRVTVAMRALARAKLADAAWSLAGGAGVGGVDASASPSSPGLASHGATAARSFTHAIELGDGDFARLDGLANSRRFREVSRKGSRNWPTHSAASRRPRGSPKERRRREPCLRRGGVNVRGAMRRPNS